MRLDISDLLVTRIHQRNFETMDSIRHLSKGIRLEYAADDPAGLALAMQLKSEEHGIIAAIENVADSLKMIDNIDGKMGNQASMLMRIRDLAVAASNEAVIDGCPTRSKIQREITALIKEIDREAKTAFYQGKKILQGNYLESIEQTPGTEVQISATTAYDPSWVDNNTILFTAAANDSGNQSGSRPSSNGADTTDRVYTRDINTTTNAPINTIQITDDPLYLYDNDGDGYWDIASGRENEPGSMNANPATDPLVIEENFPVGDPDLDGDGWSQAVDNDDNDVTETGGPTFLNLAPDVTISTVSASSMDPAAITWNNASERTFAAAANVDEITVTVATGAYTVQVRDAVAGTWSNVGTGAGAGAPATFNFAPVFADSVRVVLDDTAAATVGNVEESVNITAISGPVNNVAMDAPVNDAAPLTYSYATNPAQDIDTVRLDITPGVVFDLYADDGTGPTLFMGGVTATGPDQIVSGFGTLTGTTKIYVELQMVGAVNNIEAYNDISTVQSANPTPVTYNYTSAAVDVDSFSVNVSAGAAYNIYSDDGVAAPVLRASGVGTGAADYVDAVPAGVGQTNYYIELAGGGALNSFAVNDVTAGIALGAPVGAAVPDVETYTVNGGPQNIDYIEVTASQAFDLYVDGNLIGSGGAGMTPFAFGPVNASDIIVEMSAAGASSIVANIGGAMGALVGTTAAGSVPRVLNYTIAGTTDEIKIQTDPGAAYTVSVNGAPPVAGAGGVLNTHSLAAPETNPTVTVTFAAGSGNGAANVVSIERNDIAAQAISAQPNLTRSIKYDFGGAQDVTDVELQIDNGFAYEIYDDMGVLFGSGTGNGAVQTVTGATNSTFLRLELTDVNADDSNVVSFDVIQKQVLGAQIDATRFIRVDVTGLAPEVISRIDVNVDPGATFDITNSSGTPVYSGGSGAVGTQNLNLAPAASTDYLLFEFNIGSDINALNNVLAYNDINLNAATASFVDLNSDNKNVITYTLDPTPGNAHEEFDHLDFTVKAGHDYEIYTSNDGGGSWALLTSGTGIGADTYDANAVEIRANQIKIVLQSGNDTTNGQATIDAVVNRIDRDNDGFPDAIEDYTGTGTAPFSYVASDPLDASSTPFGSSGGPDDDGDGFLDAPELFDQHDNAPISTSPTPAGWPYVHTWTDGSGNALDVVGGQYDSTLPGAPFFIDPADLPSNIDSDGDTWADPLDPFPNTAEFMTWRDGSAASRGGNILFISNRSTPTTADQHLYLFDGSTYSLYDGASQFDNPALSADGLNGAYENTTTGNIDGYFQNTSCGGTSVITQTLVNNGTAPTWSPDNTQIAFVRGGNIWVADIQVGSPATVEVDTGIAGDDPDWSPDGDTILYTKGGGLWAYNFVTEQEYDLNIAGASNAAWSPNGTKITYEKGGYVYVCDLTITYDLPEVQVGGDNNAASMVEFAFPDARAGKLGITGINVRTQSGAEDAITTADDAINALTALRSDVGAIRNQFSSTLNSLYNQRINASAALSKIQDTDMAEEITKLVKSQILSNSASAALSHNSDILRNRSVNLINTNVADRSLTAMFA